MITKRILAMIDSVTKQIEELRNSGEKIDELYIVGLGDIVERLRRSL